MASSSANEYGVKIYIQHIDGSLHTSAGWSQRGFSQSDANGVAVISENVSFVIGKNDIGKIAWSSDGGMVEGMNSYTEEQATVDFNGKGNTELMLSTDESGAAHACDSFIFPNGKKGYLPALGELLIVSKLISHIESILITIGGSKFSSDASLYWSSSQASESNAWQWKPDRNGSSRGVSMAKRYTSNIRPFTTLEV